MTFWVKKNFWHIFSAGAFWLSKPTYILLPQKIFLQDIVPIQTVYQANKKTEKKNKNKNNTFVIDHHIESENENSQCWRWLTHVSGVTIECNNQKGK